MTIFTNDLYTNVCIDVIELTIRLRNLLKVNFRFPLFGVILASCKVTRGYALSKMLLFEQNRDQLWISICAAGPTVSQHWNKKYCWVLCSLRALTGHLTLTVRGSTLVVRI